MKKRLILIALALLVFGLFAKDLIGSNEAGFRRYSHEWFSSRNVSPIPLFDCYMIPKTRNGRCYFRVNPSELPSLEKALKLEAAPGSVSGACSEFAQDSNVQKFLSDTPPGPIFQGNVSSSFRAIYLNHKAGTGCIDLEYPYG